ncbi:MAG: TlpA family protein disulfide reductase [Desulfopila sp.]
MKYFTVLLVLFATTFLYRQPDGQAAGVEKLPEIFLPLPDDLSQRSYLGLSETADSQFALGAIDADVLVIELFSMYCPFCQEEAENVNTLYELMENFSKPEFSVKMIGIGANNSAFEVEHFRNTYAVRFPLFPDPEMSMYNALGGKGTPGFIAYRKQEDGSWLIIHRQSGGFYNVEEFFKELLHKSGYN